MLVGWGKYYRPGDIDEDEVIMWFARLQFIEVLLDMAQTRDSLVEKIYLRFYSLIQDLNRLKSGDKISFIPKEWTYSDAQKTIITWEAIINHIGMPLNNTNDFVTYFLSIDGYLRTLDIVNKNRWDCQLIALAKDIREWVNIFNSADQYWICRILVLFLWRKAISTTNRKISSFLLDDALSFIPSNSSLYSDEKESDLASKFLLDSNQINYVVENWNPILETEDQAKKRIINDFEKFLDVQFDIRDKFCRGIGYQKTPMKRNPEHFKWLAQYIYEGKDYQSIAQEYADADPDGSKDIGTDAVRKAIVSVAALIKIEIRK